MEQSTQNTERLISICENGVYVVWKIDKYQILR